LNALDAPNKPLRDELQARNDILTAKKAEAKAAKAQSESASSFDWDAHSYPQILSHWARDEHWAEILPAGPDGVLADRFKWAGPAGANKFKGW